MAVKNNSSNTSPKRSYKVFVSSTYLDNIERRRIVQDAVTMAGMVWHGMELFEANAKPTRKVCIKYANEADVLVPCLKRFQPKVGNIKSQITPCISPVI